MHRNLISCCLKNENDKVLHFCSKRTIYWFLASLRILLNFIPQTGYIHPDEFFQYMEVVSGDTFDIDVYKPWEFNVTFPVRNSFFPHLCTRIPYIILQILNPFLGYYFGVSLNTPYCLVLFPRLFMTIISFISDYCLYKICLVFGQPYVDRLTIFASSYVMLTYCTRTFSNSIEMILMALLLYHVSRCIEFSNKVVAQSDYLATRYYKAKGGYERAKIYKLWRSLPSHSLNDCFMLATIVVFGIFCRPTFIVFALCPIFFWLNRGLGSKTVGLMDFHVRIFMFIIAAVPSVIGLIIYDSLYFGYLTPEEVAKSQISINNFVVTPFNFFKSHLLTDNLEDFGIHPRLLHVLINVPLLFNVLGIIGIYTFSKMLNSAMRKKWLELPRIRDIESLMITSLVIPILLLSIFPDQEPRFLIPVLLPVVFLFADQIRGTSTGPVKVAKKKEDLQLRDNNDYKLKIWYICNIILTIFYGFLHQGGIFPLTSHLARELRSKPDLLHIHYLSSYTYPLPTSLLHLRNTRRFFTSDSGHRYTLTQDFYLKELGSKSVDLVYYELALALKRCEEDFQTKNIPYRLYYALPHSFYDEFAEHANNQTQFFQFDIAKSFFPHFSTEIFPEIESLWNCYHSNDLVQCMLIVVENVSNSILHFSQYYDLILLKIEPIS